MIEAAITVKNWIKWEFDPDSEKWENRYRRTIELSSCSSDHNPDCIVWLSWQLNLPRQMVKFLPDHMTMNHSSQHECLNLILDLRTDSSLGLRWYRYLAISRPWNLVTTNYGIWECQIPGYTKFSSSFLSAAIFTFFAIVVETNHKSVM